MTDKGWRFTGNEKKYLVFCVLPEKIKNMCWIFFQKIIFFLIFQMYILWKI